KKVVLVLAWRIPRNVRGAAQSLIGAFIVGKTKPDLLQAIGALGAPRGFTCRLHGRQQESHQNADDRNYHEQFDERKSAPHSTPCSRKAHFVGPHASTTGILSTYVQVRCKLY